MLFLDFLLLIMIMVCVSYCWILNRRIQDLQNSRIEFARMIKELNASIIKAENNVNEMSELSKITSAQIRSVVDEARERIAELASISEIASTISSSLSEKIRSFNNQQASQNAEYVYENTLTSKSGERFSDEDLDTHNDIIAIREEASRDQTPSYASNLKSFIQNIVTRKIDPGQTLNQMSYYDTLRKINAKK